MAPSTSDLAIFQSHRPALTGLAYRMLGEFSRAEDVVQNAWVRWCERQTEAEVPRSFLLTTVARLCLDELGAARHRWEAREESADGLPEPVDLDDTELARLETLEQLSYAFLVILQRLTPPERAVLLLHDVFDMSHRDVAALLGRSEVACRQLLKRARRHVSEERRKADASPEEHRRLFEAFVRAMSTGDMGTLASLLAEDAVLVVDPGAASSYGRMRALGGPIHGPARIVSVVRGFLEQPDTEGIVYLPRTLNGEPGMVTSAGGRVTSAVTVAVAAGKIQRVYVQYDAAKLRHLGGWPGR